MAEQNLPSPAARLTKDDGRPEEIWYQRFQQMWAAFNTLQTSQAADSETLASVDALTTRGDLLTRGATAYVRLPIGASGTQLVSDGTDPAWETPSLVPVMAGDAAGTTLDVALSDAYDMYEIDLINVAPATDNVVAWLRFSQAGSFLAGASDYCWGTIAGATYAVDEADSEIQITGTVTVGNSTNENLTGTVRIFRPGEASFQKTATFHGFGRNLTPASYEFSGGGALLLNSDAIDGVRFLFASGAIASGYYAVRGYKFS